MAAAVVAAADCAAADVAAGTGSVLAGLGADIDSARSALEAAGIAAAAGTPASCPESVSC